MIGLAVSSITLLLSLVALGTASHFTIRHVEDFIEATSLSEASAGFIILSLMSTLPEMTVASFAVYQGVAAISVGDILGSHIFNIGIVIGILGVMGSLEACCTDMLVELVDILFLASIVPLLLVISRITLVGPPGIGQLLGVALLGMFAFSIYRMAKRKSPALSDSAEKPSRRANMSKIILWILLGAGVVIVSSHFAVSSASEIAYELGMPRVLIGAKIVAVGTSLPELAFCLTAARRRRVHLALGDAIGANLTTITLVLGSVLLTSPFAINITAFTEILLFVLATNILLWRYLTKGGVSRLGGIMLIMIYILFQATLTH